MLSIFLTILLLFIMVNIIDTTNIRKQSRTSIIGKEFGGLFENDIRELLLKAEYRDVYGDDGMINNLYVTSGKQSSKVKLDALVTGRKHSFDKFRDNFVSSYVCSPPLEDTHIAIVEVKLTVDLLREWIRGLGGSQFLFFKDNMTKITKVLVINGGAKSAAFVENLSSTNDIEEFAEVKAAIIKAKINVFYKLWASGESFSDICDRCDKLEKENQELNILCHKLEKENQELNILCHKLEKENQELNILCHKLEKENQDIKMKLDMIVSMLNLKFNDEI